MDREKNCFLAREVLIQRTHTDAGNFCDAGCGESPKAITPQNANACFENILSHLEGPRLLRLFPRRQQRPPLHEEPRWETRIPNASIYSYSTVESLQPSRT